MATAMRSGVREGRGDDAPARYGRRLSGFVFRTALAVLAASLLTPSASVCATQESAAVLSAPQDRGRIILSDLGVALQMPPGFEEAPLVLGLDHERRIVVLIRGEDGSVEMVRFHPTTGELRSRKPLPVPRSDILRGRVASCAGGSHVCILDANHILMFDLEGRALPPVELPFYPRSIVVSQGDTILLDVPQNETRPLLYGVALGEGGAPPRVEALTTPSTDGLDHGPRVGAVDSSRSLWTASPERLVFERWDLAALNRSGELALHPSVRHYLSSAYSRVRVAAIHLVDDDQLWVFLTLRRRVAPLGPFESEQEKVTAESDGLVEVIDLERHQVVASQFFPSFELAGWVSGPIGYRAVEPGMLELVHVRVVSVEDESGLL